LETAIINLQTGKQVNGVNNDSGTPTMECKYWLNRENFDLEEAFAYNMSPRDKRQIRKINYEHFEYIEQQWDEFQRRRLQ
jgi:hypothetical protein